jgi:hypothetical protein
MEILRKDRDLYQAITFCEKAIDKKHPKLAIRNLLIDNGTLIATDSHKMHMIYSEKLKSIQNGLYILEKNKFGLEFVKSDYDGEYPDWKKLLSQDKSILYDEKFTCKTKGKFISDILYSLSKYEIKIDYTYLLNLHGLKWEWQMFLYDTNDPIVFKRSQGDIKYCSLIMRYGIK